LRDEINCQFCGKTFSSSPQLRDRVWAYRLSGVFARTRDHEGALPVAMTLLQFKRSSMFQPFTYTCGMDLEWAEPGNQVKVETDFVVIRRNRDDQPIVLLGECKNNKSLCSPDEQEKVERLIKVGDKLRDVGIDSFITFSKAGGPFTPEELDFLDQKQTIHLNFVLLSPEELEPYSPYEVSLAARKVRLATPMSLEEWAANSQQLYLKTKPEEVFEKWRASKVEGASS